MRRVQHAMIAAGAGAVLALLSACGDRVSLGELPADERTTDDGTTPPIPGSGDAAPSPGTDAALPVVDGGGEISPDSGDQDAGQGPYIPCAGKACGESCRVCDPADPNCFETAVIKECDKTGACVPAPGGC